MCMYVYVYIYIYMCVCVPLYLYKNLVTAPPAILQVFTYSERKKVGAFQLSGKLGTGLGGGLKEP